MELSEILKFMICVSVFYLPFCVAVYLRGLNGAVGLAL